MRAVLFVSACNCGLVCVCCAWSWAVRRAMASGSGGKRWPARGVAALMRVGERARRVQARRVGGWLSFAWCSAGVWLACVDGLVGLRVVCVEVGGGGGDALACCEEGVAEDAEDPGLEVGAGLEGVEGAEGLGEGLLHEVFGFGLIAGEPEGVIVERGEEWG